jgi:hypothetical protein
VPALREILKRSGILDGGPNIALPEERLVHRGILWMRRREAGNEARQVAVIQR